MRLAGFPRGRRGPTAISAPSGGFAPSASARRRAPATTIRCCCSANNPMSHKMMSAIDTSFDDGNPTTGTVVAPPSPATTSRTPTAGSRAGARWPSDRQAGNFRPTDLLIPGRPIEAHRSRPTDCRPLSPPATAPARDSQPAASTRMRPIPSSHDHAAAQLRCIRRSHGHRDERAIMARTTVSPP